MTQASTAQPQGAAASPSGLERLSVVVPALEAARHLPRCLTALRQGQPGEVIVVDGGSTDGTGLIAEQEGARAISAPRGRGSQLAAGAREARGDWLLFLHADTRLGPRWPGAAERFIADTGGTWRAGWFRLGFDEPESPAAARVARLANWRSRAFGLPYGDQGLLIPADFYRALGGYNLYRLMEDVDLVRRIGRGRLQELQATAWTSPGRYRRDGWILRPARNLTLLSLYFLGVPPDLLARLYR
jgi:rSAM/selenodomain-associated transferase 2